MSGCGQEKIYCSPPGVLNKYVGIYVLYYQCKCFIIPTLPHSKTADLPGPTMAQCICRHTRLQFGNSLFKYTLLVTVKFKF